MWPSTSTLLRCSERVVLAYTGAPHFSGTNNWEIMKRHIDGDRHVVRRASIASWTRPPASATPSRRGDWTAVAHQINREWEARKQLAPGVTTPMIEALMQSAFAAGARAAKVCGAGGGGCLFCLAEPKDVPAVQQALTSGGARLLDYRIETDGLRVDRRVDSRRTEDSLSLVVSCEFRTSLIKDNKSFS